MNRVDAVTALKGAAIKVYGVLAVETDPTGGIQQISSQGHIRVTDALNQAHSAIYSAIALLNNLD